MGVPRCRLSVCWIELSLITSILSLSAKLEKAVVDIIRSVKNVHGYWDLVRDNQDVSHLQRCSPAALSSDRPSSDAR